VVPAKKEEAVSPKPLEQERARPLPQLLIGLGVIALGLVLAALVAGLLAADAVRDARRMRDTITVTGSAREQITADHVSWNLYLSVQDQDPAVASRELRKQAQAVRSFLSQAGLPAAALNEPPIGIDEVEERVPGSSGKMISVPAFRVYQNIEVSSTDIDLVEKVAARLSELIERGIPVSSAPLSYIATPAFLNKARIAALKKATANARQRAETIVSGLDGHLGAVRSASLGVYQVTPRNSTDVSDYGINDTSTRLKDVTAVVTVEFAVS
jgi:hypothetical protein